METRTSTEELKAPPRTISRFWSYDIEGTRFDLPDFYQPIMTVGSLSS